MENLSMGHSPSSRSQTAASAVKNGFVEEAVYDIDHIEAGRPIRLECPTTMDAPGRVPLPPQDALLVRRLFSPAAHRDRKRGISYVSAPDLMCQLNDTTDNSKFKSKMRDAQMLATASRRAGDGESEGLSFFRVALLQDNLRAYNNAIKAYKKYLAICERLNDTPGIGLALNCIGVNLQCMAADENDQQRKNKLLNAAVSYHERHFEIGDTPSQFVAKINSGLVLLEQDEYEKSISSFQDALKYALILKAPREQSVAFGNLGIASFTLGSFESAVQSVEQQLSILEEIPGAEEEAARAHLLFARLLGAQEEHVQAKQEAEEAMALAKKANARGLAKMAKCLVGASLGRSMFDEVIRDTAKQLKRNMKVSR